MARSRLHPAVQNLHLWGKRATGQVSLGPDRLEEPWSGLGATLPGSLPMDRVMGSADAQSSGAPARGSPARVDTAALRSASIGALLVLDQAFGQEVLHHRVDGCFEVVGLH